MAAGPISERNQDATVYVGGLDEKVSEPLLWELFLQAGPVVNTHMPKDRVTGQHQGYGFVEFLSEEDADYAIKIMNMIKLYGKPIRVNKASAHNKNLDVGANIFIGNLDPEIDEKLLYDTFSAFGVILQTPKIMRDPDTGNSKGYAFINFASFDASDAAIEAMNGQYLCNRPITVSYAFKKDSKGERHGSAAERLLAAQNPLSQADRPHQLFADAPPPPSAPNPVVSSLGSGLPPPAVGGEEEEEKTLREWDTEAMIDERGEWSEIVVKKIVAFLLELDHLEYWQEGKELTLPTDARLRQACHLLAPSHRQYHLPERSHLEYRQLCPHHLCLGLLEDMVPAGTPGAGHPGHGHSHPHPFPPAGMPHPGMSQMQLAHHGPHGLGHPHAGPPGSGGQPPPRPPPGMPHPGPPPMGMPPRGPPFGSPMGHPGPMPPHGMRGPPPLMPPHGYTGPPRPPPYGYQRGPLPPPRPTPRPPVPPRGPLRGPLPQ
ncbi:Splicing factor 3B subunit 4 [Heterocephalus glaber]|uniref:Splicing factor 3B subunit 4 n=1 Tax=Heterocephalus glaber TaxID=10181 RepID=G5BH25_HETGA|nr:Splicing factor 3B subunit 4 [Heterocephalus glaber]